MANSTSAQFVRQIVAEVACEAVPNSSGNSRDNIKMTCAQICTFTPALLLLFPAALVIGFIRTQFGHAEQVDPETWQCGPDRVACAFMALASVIALTPFGLVFAAGKSLVAGSAGIFFFGLIAILHLIGLRKENLVIWDSQGIRGHAVGWIRARPLHVNWVDIARFQKGSNACRLFDQSGQQVMIWAKSYKGWRDLEAALRDKRPDLF